MKSVWEARNAGADTEEKLLASILRLIADNSKSYSAQDGRVVLDRNDILELAGELEQ